MQEHYNDGILQSSNPGGIFEGIQFCIYGPRKGTEKFNQDIHFVLVLVVLLHYNNQLVKPSDKNQKLINSVKI